MWVWKLKSILFLYFMTIIKIFSWNRKTFLILEYGNDNDPNINMNTILAIIFWDFLLFFQILLSPQAKRIVVISNKYGIYKLPHELTIDLRLRTLGY